MAVLLLAVCLISQLRLAGRERQRQAAQQNSVEQLTCSGTGGYPVYARNCGYVQYDKGEHVGRIARALAVEKNGIWLRLDVPGAVAGLYHKKE